MPGFCARVRFRDFLRPPLGPIASPVVKALAISLVFALAASCAAVKDVVDPILSSPGAGGTSAGGRPGEPSGSGSKPGASGYDDDGSLGSMVRTFLRSSPARTLVVEVDYVKGSAPSSRALAHLAEVLKGVADKPGGVTVAAGNEIPSGRDRWSIGDLRALEKTHRSSRSGGATATMWIAYVDGEYADGGGALGVAYSASAAAIFRDRIGDATTAIVGTTAIERSVITHEAGHLLALVNIGYTSAIAHEDKDNPHHSNNKNSVMYWAVEDLSIANILAGGPPDTFDDADKADLAALKDG